MFGCGPERCTSDHSQLPPRVPYSGSAIRDCCDAEKADESAEGVRDEHSESGAGPDSISDIARSNPGDVLAIAAFQRPLRELPINFR